MVPKGGEAPWQSLLANEYSRVGQLCRAPAHIIAACFVPALNASVKIQVSQPAWGTEVAVSSVGLLRWMQTTRC